MAQIKRRGNTFQIRISNGSDRNGKQRFIYETYRPELITKSGKKRTDGALEEEAKGYAAELERKIKRGEYNFNQTMTFGDLYDKWLKNWFQVVKKPSPAIRKSYKDNLEWYVVPFLADHKLSEIKKATLERLYIRLSEEIVKDKQKSPLKKSSIAKVHQAVRCIYKYAVADELTDRNPCHDIDLSSIIPEEEVREEADCFTFDQAEAFMGFINSPFERETSPFMSIIHGEKKLVEAYKSVYKPQIIWDAYFRLAINEGLRRGEILALNWNDILFDSVEDDAGKKYTQIMVNKTVAQDENHHEYVKGSPKTKNGIRRKTIMTETAEALRNWREKWTAIGEAPVFIQEGTFSRMSLATPSHKFKALLKYYNAKNPDDQLPDIHLHSLRKTSITFEYDADIQEGTIAQRHGHSDRNITRHYKQLTPESDLLATKKKEEFYNMRRAALQRKKIRMASE